jgi:hypothetical protein
VSIATEISRLVSSSVEHWRLKWAMLLHPIIDRRKLPALDHLIRIRGRIVVRRLGRRDGG